VRAAPQEDGFETRSKGKKKGEKRYKIIVYPGPIERTDGPLNFMKPKLHRKRWNTLNF
jgi:hypothetical protein